MKKAPAPALIISEELSELVFNSRKLPEFAEAFVTLILDLAVINLLNLYLLHLHS